MRRPLMREPREMPPVSDGLWRYWCADLRQRINRNPKNWSELEGIADELRIGQEFLRNLLAYMEGEGYAVSFYLVGRLVWCGCQRRCGVANRRCSCSKGAV